MNRKLNNVLIAIAGILIFLAIYFNFYNGSLIFEGLGLIIIFFLYNKFFKKRINPEIGSQIQNVVKASSLLLSIFFFIVSSFTFIMLGFCGTCQEMVIFACVFSALAATPMILIGTILFCNAMNENIGFKIFSGILLVNFVFIEILILPICFSFLDNDSMKPSNMDWLMWPAAIATLISIIILMRRIIRKSDLIKADQVDQININKSTNEVNIEKKNYKKSILTLIIIIVCVLSWIIIDIFFPAIPTHPYATSSEQINALDECYKVARDETLRFICIEEVAVEYKNENICEEIASYSSWKNACYRDVAVSKKDPELCKKSSEEWVKDECYKDLAVLLNDVYLCKDSGLLKEVCFKEVGIEQELIKRAVEYNLSILFEELKASFPGMEFASYYYNKDDFRKDYLIGRITGHTEKLIYLDDVIDDLNEKTSELIRGASCGDCAFKKITNPNDPLDFNIDITFWRHAFNLEDYL